MRWSPDLRSRWLYPGKESGFGFIDDCYALNVDGTTAWTCYDADFPIVRIGDDQIAGWRNNVRRAAALATHGTSAALYGDRLTVGELTCGRFEPRSEHRVARPDGSLMPAHTQVVGRGSTLHFITDDYWYQLSIREIATRPAVTKD